jgi:hypothetical protein
MHSTKKISRGESDTGKTLQKWQVTWQCEEGVLLVEGHLESLTHL